MNAKSLITIALLIFVGACVVALAVNGFQQPGADQQPQASAQDANASGASDSAPPAAAINGSSQEPNAPVEPSSVGGRRVRALYFHGNIRCPTCRKIEQYAHQAIQAAFADELQSGKLTWQVINYDQPGNQSYIERYELVAPTLVLVQMEGEREVEYENLMEVWQLAGNPQAFFRFVQDHVRAMLDTGEE